MKNVMFALWRAFVRRKPIEKNESTRLKKCLGTTELTALGIGSTLGIGIYVIIGTVAYKQAGNGLIFVCFQNKILVNCLIFRSIGCNQFYHCGDIKYFCRTLLCW